jgi:outer membrane lipoprotein-sorting protein
MFVLFLSFVATITAQDADAIMQKVKDTMGGFGSGGSMGSRDTIVVTDKNGNKGAAMTIDQFSKEDANGNARTVVQFLAPPAQAKTRFLTKDNGKGGSDQWIYLPSLNKVRRIASSESGGSFMGTDFSYDDMSITSRDTDDDTKTKLADGTADGKACFVVQSVPKDSDYQYQKMLYFVGKDDSLVYKIELYKNSNDANATKIMELSGYQADKGKDGTVHMTPHSMKISTVAAGTNTVITMNRVEYDMNIPEGVFDTDYLQTGRAR